VVIFSKIMIMKLNEGLDCFFHRSQLNECHFAIFPENGIRNTDLESNLFPNFLCPLEEFTELS
jgi:hypothetical protein